MKVLPYLQLQVLGVCLLLVLPSEATSNSFWSTAASFVPPASPQIVQSKADTDARCEEALVGGYGVYGQSDRTSGGSSTTKLFLAKKKSAAAATKKVQVKMLKHVAGTGQAGEVVRVSPAFFQNKLRPTNAAELISDEQVALEQAAAEAKDLADQTAAEQLQTTLAEYQLRLQRKVGPGGHLFGAVSSKTIMESLQNQIQNDFLRNKFVKVVALTDENGKKLRGDIKDVGSYRATISLGKGISAKVIVQVEPQE